MSVRPSQAIRTPTTWQVLGVSLLLAVLSVSLVLMTGCQKHPSPSQTDASSREAERNSTWKESPTKVLLVQSYHAGYPWVDAITRGVRWALSNANVDLQVYHMDTKRKTSEAWKRTSGRNVKIILEDWKPEIVIAADENAQEYFAKDYVGKESPQIVFCGVNANPQKYDYPASNVTGVLERPHLTASLELLRKLQPDSTRIAIVTDDSPTSKEALTFLLPPPAPFRIVSVRTPSTFSAWKEAIARAQTTADAIAIYMYHTVKEHPDEESLPPSHVMAWTAKNSRIPIIGFFIFSVDDGALCGYLESGVEHGRKAGDMVKQILQGKPAGAIPIITALDGQSMLNLKTARRLGISVPPEVVEHTDVVIGQ